LGGDACVVGLFIQFENSEALSEWAKEDLVCPSNSPKSVSFKFFQIVTAEASTLVSAITHSAVSRARLAGLDMIFPIFAD
jgi:hypothetical protein